MADASYSPHFDAIYLSMKMTKWRTPHRLFPNNTTNQPNNKQSTHFDIQSHISRLIDAWGAARIQISHGLLELEWGEGEWGLIAPINIYVYISVDFIYMAWLSICGIFHMIPMCQLAWWNLNEYICHQLLCGIKHGG